MNRFIVPTCNPKLAPPTDIDVPFEGVEKRLVVHFKPNKLTCTPYEFTTSEWQSILDYAHCEIVSERHLEDTKVYLLSESTLTVWPHGFLLKTCGRTTPFLVLDVLAKYVYPDSQLVDLIDWMTYSRLDFLHPQYQVWPHQSHEQETEYLRHIVPQAVPFSLPAGRHALVGFVYSPEAPVNANVQFEEALMMQVDRHCVRSFAGFDTPEEQKFDDGKDHHGYLRPVLSGSRKELDEFWFSPFGYSSNALAAGPSDQHATYFSCHVSPEPETSYASLEVGGCGNSALIPLCELVPAFNAKFVHITKVCVRPHLVKDLESQLAAVSQTLQVGYNLMQSSSVAIGHIAVHHLLLERPVAEFLSLADCPLLSFDKGLQKPDQVTTAQTTASGDEMSDKVISQD